VELGSSAELSTAVDTWRHSFGLPEAQQQAGLAIRRQIWEPLLSHIADAATILVSTDGPLGRIPLGALPGKEPGKYLLEDHRIAMIPVPQLLPALVNDAAHTATSQGLLLLGDVDYNSEAPHAAGTKATERKKRRIGEYPRDLVDVEYETLPGAAEEVELIRKLYSELPGNKATDIQLLKQSEASEAAFRENAGKFRHIHVATHGFFAPVGAPAASSNEFPARMLEFQARGFNPDVLSGLAFAGANLQPEPGKDDGILTAQEIAFLPLNGVDTAVLSVCESGLGSSTGGEGLISVQRAFQISGVRTTVASLWEVDDRVTQFLMERFYRNLWEMKMSRLDALRDAQLYLLKNPQKVSELLRSIKRPEQPQKFSDLSPFHWAAFTLSGDWR
jgi:CHAT domain-containing protein